jgi:uncharacterized protein (TIGR03067 family)
MRGLAVFAALIVVGPVAADDGGAEQKKFAGTWKLKDGSADGVRLPPEVRDIARLVFADDRFTFRGGPQERTTTFTVDPAAGTIQVAPPKGETRTLRGRYRFDGPTLTLVLTDADKTPEKIEAGPDRLVLILVRDK